MLSSPHVDLLPMLTKLTSVGLALHLGSCAVAITNIPYIPQPSRVANPAAEVKALIQANTSGNCTTTPDVQSILIVVQSNCTGYDVHGGGYVTTGSQVVRLDHVGSIEIQKSGAWFNVLVHHNNGADDFEWTSRSLGDMVRLADAITALAKPPLAGPAQPQ